MLRWKLREVMARYNITGVALAKELNLTTVAISNMRQSNTIPRIDGNRIKELTEALSKLAETKITFYDLFEETEKERLNFRMPITA